MDKFQIGMLYNGLFTSNAIFAGVFIFLLWMMFRGANQSHERGANLIQKILGSVVSLCVIACNLNIGCQDTSLQNPSDYELWASNLNFDNIALGRLPTNVTTDPTVKSLRELAYLPKGVMDPHEVSPSDVRVGKLPEEVYDWMKREINDKEDPTNKPKD